LLPSATLTGYACFSLATQDSFSLVLDAARFEIIVNPTAVNRYDEPLP